MIRVGSLFSGIGGMEIGLSRAIPDAVPVWFCEQNTFCQSILSKHWQGVRIYNDVKNINKSNVEQIDILTGGFPCQSISVSGKMEGLENEEKSGLWWEMLRIIGDLRPRIVIMENVANIVRLGGCDVVGSLARIGYDVEWEIVSARQFGAPHLRKRWFGVAYVADPVSPQSQNQSVDPVPTQRETFELYKYRVRENVSKRNESNNRSGYWFTNPRPPRFCRVDDGISHRLARLKALGNAIVPACSEYVGRCIVESGLIDDLISGGEK